MKACIVMALCVIGCAEHTELPCQSNSGTFERVMYVSDGDCSHDLNLVLQDAFSGYEALDAQACGPAYVEPPAAALSHDDECLSVWSFVEGSVIEDGRFFTLHLSLQGERCPVRCENNYHLIWRPSP